MTLYTNDSQKLSIDFVSNLELMAEKSNQMRTKFQEIDDLFNEQMKKIFDQLNELSK